MRLRSTFSYEISITVDPSTFWPSTSTVAMTRKRFVALCPPLHAATSNSNPTIGTNIHFFMLCPDG
jgi:hypothetical protein